MVLGKQWEIPRRSGQDKTLFNQCIPKSCCWGLCPTRAQRALFEISAAVVVYCVFLYVGVRRQPPSDTDPLAVDDFLCFVQVRVKRSGIIRVFFFP